MTYDGTLVRLRPMVLADAAAQHRWFADPEVTRYLPIRYPTSLAALEARLADAEPDGFANRRFSVERRDTGDLIGYAALRDVTPESRNAELDLVLGERSGWAQGLGTDVAVTLCRVAFEGMGLHRVHLWVLAADAAALRGYEQAGFEREGVARDRLYKNGSYHDTVLMARLA